MAILQIGLHDAIYYEHNTPTVEGGKTFVFFNALTGDTNTWEAVIGPRLRSAGHGTLAYNFRGQTASPFSKGLRLGSDLIIEDAIRLLNEIGPARPIFVGLSIGGLFAARAWFKGAEATGLVLINTLRKQGPRLKWIGDAVVRAVEVGGLELFRDLYIPMLFNEDWLKENREQFLKPAPAYSPLSPDSGLFKLLAEAGRDADWDLPYEQLTLPTLVITGLHDHIFFDDNVVSDLFNRLPRGQRIELSDSGHLIPAERPDALSDILLSFGKEMG